MKILMMGPQASGKGTIGEMLGAKLDLPVASVGGILRNLPLYSPYYHEIHKAMNEGVLAPNQTVAKILKEEVSKPAYSKGYILDGWARQLSDLDYFNPGFDHIVVLNISKEMSLKRISGRRICSTDGETYNIYTMSKEELDKCKGTLTQREDDTESAVKERLEIYHNTTQKVVDYLKKYNIVIEINGEGSPQQVFAETLSKLGMKSK